MLTVRDLLGRLPRHSGGADRSPSVVVCSAPRPTAGQVACEAAYAEFRGTLDDLLPDECRDWLWYDAWERGVTTMSLRRWQSRFGPETAALAVAAGLTEEDLRYHLDGGPVPEPAMLEMLADLNCFPFAPQAARPVDQQLAQILGGQL